MPYLKNDPIDPLIRSLVARRHTLKISQIDIAKAMETSRYQILQFEAGHDKSWSFINRYAAVINTSISVTIEYLNA